MPIEIRELVIRAVALPDQENEEKVEEPPRQALVPLPDQEAMIQECVRQVLQILRKEKER